MSKHIQSPFLFPMNKRVI